MRFGVQPVKDSHNVILFFLYCKGANFFFSAPRVVGLPTDTSTFPLIPSVNPAACSCVYISFAQSTNYRMNSFNQLDRLGLLMLILANQLPKVNMFGVEICSHCGRAATLSSSLHLLLLFLFSLEGQPAAGFGAFGGTPQPG